MKRDFKKKKWKNLIIAFAIIFFVGAGFVIGSNFIPENEGNGEFEIDTLFLKTAVTENGSFSSSIKIINTDTKSQHFSLVIRGISDIVRLEENEFIIGPGGEKTVKINYKIEGKSPNVYTGKIEIYSDKGRKNIPIILEVQSKEVLFDSNVNIFPQGTEIILGQNLNAEIKIFDLVNAGRSSVSLSYIIKDFDGNIIFSDSDDFIVDGKLDYSKSFDLSSDLKPVSYVLIIIVKYNGSVGTSSVYFKVFKNRSEIYTEKGAIIALFVFFFLIFLILFFYSVTSRDRLLNELKNEYRREVRRQNEIIRCREKKEIVKLKPVEKKIYIREVKKIKKQRIKAVKNIHKKRMIEYKRIKKRGKKNEAFKKIEEWKKQGYDTSILDKKYKMPNVSEIKRKVAQWKKKGYNTGMLESK